MAISWSTLSSPPRGKFGTGSTQRYRGMTNYLFVAPAVIFLAAFMCYPIGFNIAMSFRNVQGSTLVTGGAFCGWDNYLKTQSALKPCSTRPFSQESAFSSR